MVPKVAKLLVFRRSFYSAKRLSSSSSYDIVITGGGMVGSAFACNCGASTSLKEKKVLLLEAANPTIYDTTPESYSNRVSAVNPSSQKLFQRLDAWEEMVKLRVCPVSQLRVWESYSNSRINFKHPDANMEVAHIIENNAIVSALLKQVKKCSNVEIRNNTKVKNCTLPETLSNLAKIELENGELIETKLIIGADGFQSQIRKAMGFQYVQWNYDQKAIVATLDISLEGPNTTAWQRFGAHGPIAILPLNEHMSSLVWTTTKEDADRLLELNDDQFVDELNHALLDDSRLDSLTNQALFAYESLLNAIAPSSHDSAELPPTIVNVTENSRASFPLGLGHPLHYVAPRVALIGDAAHRVHPLAGMGVNLGFGDVICLTSVLERALKRGADLGSLMHLREYENERQRKNVPVMVAIDWLNRLYRYHWSPMVLVRSLGLATAHRLTPLKDLIMVEASR